MKKFNVLLILLLISFNVLLSQDEKLDIHFKITEKQEINTSSVKIYYHLSGKRFDSLFYKNYKKENKFYLDIEFNNKIKKVIIENQYDFFTLDGVNPGSDILIKSFYNISSSKNSLGGDYLILDTLIKSNKIRFIHIENPKRVSFEKKYKLEENNYFITNGTRVNNNGNYIGAYTINGFMKNRIKEDGTNLWYKKNGIIGFSGGLPLFFSGFDKYENKVDYYNSGLYIRDHIVVLKKEKKIINVDWLIQNGPILIKDKKNNCKSFNKEKKPRSAIGFDSVHYLYYIISLEPITLYYFSEELLKRKMDGALLLDGAGYKDKYGQYGKIDKKNMNIIFYKK